MKLDCRYVISERKDNERQAIHNLQEQIHHFSFLFDLVVRCKHGLGRKGLTFTEKAR